MSMHLQKKPFLAFTLLEMLLVIVIMAIMATAGINFYQDYSTINKTNKTAQQMQLILQAAAAYYTDYNCWPNGSDCPTNAPPFNNYLAGITVNPWGANYHYQVEPVAQKKFQVYSGALPNPTNSNPNPFVQRIIAQLANSGIAPNSPDEVLAEITVPQKLLPQPPSDYQLISISSSGTQSEGSTFTATFQCPTGWIGNSAAIPYNITTLTYDYGKKTKNCAGGSRAFGVLTAEHVPCQQISQTPNMYQCNYVVSINGTVPKNDTLCVLHTQEASGSVSFAVLNWCYNAALSAQKIKAL